jgi:hypothetical protein
MHAVHRRPDSITDARDAEDAPASFGAPVRIDTERRAQGLGWVWSYRPVRSRTEWLFSCLLIKGNSWDLKSPTFPATTSSAWG